MSSQPPNNSRTNKILNILNTLKRDFLAVRENRVRAWHAWLAIGIASGIVVAILFVANQSGEFIPAYAVPKSGPPKNQLEVATVHVFKLVREYRATPEDERAQIHGKLLFAIAERKALLLSSIAENPRSILSVVLPPRVLGDIPDDIAAQLEMPVLLSGELEVFHSDGPEGGPFQPEFAKFHYFLRGADNQRFQLHFAGEEPRILFGSRVRARGVKIDKNVIVESAIGPDFEVLSEVLPGHTVKKTAVILFNLQNNPVQPYTTDTARSVTFTGSGSSNAYYQQVSFGKLSLAGSTRPDGDVYGWHTIPYDDTSCNYSSWASAAESMAKANGFARTNYNSIIYGFPRTSACGWWGLGTLGGNPAQSWVNGSYSLRVVGHEQGHNWGVHHSSSYSCADETGTRVTISNKCTKSEYGDPFDIMGASTNHMNNFQKGRLNWFDAANTRNVAVDGEYAITPLEKASAGTQALRILRTSKPVQYFYLEFRQPFGFDNFSPTSPVVNGVSLRLGPEYTTLDSPLLLDATPETTSFSDSALAVGKSVTDAMTGISVTTLAVSPEGALVDVKLGAGSCVRANPSISVSPTNQWGYAGDSLTYRATITNNDSSFCSPANFTITPTLPAGWQQGPSPLIVNVSPGSSASQTFSITSPVSATEGYYSITERAINNDAPSFFSASAAITYTVEALDVTPPIIQIKSPADGATLSERGNVKINVSASDASGIASIQIFIDGVQLKRCTNTTSCQANWGMKDVSSGLHTISVTAIDKSPNQNSASKSITVTKP